MSVDNSWVADSACGKLDLKKYNFFADNPNMQKKCKKICRDECPVRRNCLSTALNNTEIYGIWGGNSELELREALAVDEELNPHDYGKPIQCPDCHSLDVETVKKRRARIDVECNSCKLEWTRRRIVKSRKKVLD